VRRPSRAFACAWIALLLCAACGKKGPPLPPLVKLPAAPADLIAERRGDDVTVRFRVPATNTDNTKPANVERVDVYAFNGPTSVSDDDLLKHGTKIGSVAVKAPKNPDDTVDEDEPAEDAEPPEGAGLDQGAAAHVDDRLTAESRRPSEVPPAKRSRAQRRAESRSGPLVGPSTLAVSRVYAGVGISTRGRRGALSRRVSVPLVDPPPPPSELVATYDESAIALKWSGPEQPDGATLPSHPLGTGTPAIGYNVYERPAATAASTSVANTEVRLTQAPLDDPTFADKRMDWGQHRCYVVRTIETLGDLRIESADSAPKCVDLADTFPPAAPKGLHSVPSEGAISLLWDSNSEGDLAGYLVLRGTSNDALQPITNAPITEVNFKDTVPSGIRYFYAVVAVDKAGNKSAPSASVDETARD
jgi:hypothetical protein